MIFREILTEYGINTKREGDDIFVDDRKLSISIASISLSSAKIHFALNLEDKGTPDDVETIGGLVVKTLGRIADINDVVIFNGLTFTVLEIDGARITKLQILKEITAELLNTTEDI